MRKTPYSSTGPRSCSRTPGDLVGGERPGAERGLSIGHHGEGGPADGAFVADYAAGRDAVDAVLVGGDWAEVVVAVDAAGDLVAGEVVEGDVVSSEVEALELFDGDLGGRPPQQGRPEESPSPLRPSPVEGEGEEPDPTSPLWRPCLRRDDGGVAALLGSWLCVAAARGVTLGPREYGLSVEGERRLGGVWEPRGDGQAARGQPETTAGVFDQFRHSFNNERPHDGPGAAAPLEGFGFRRSTEQECRASAATARSGGSWST